MDRREDALFPYFSDNGKEDGSLVTPVKSVSFAFIDGEGDDVGLRGRKDSCF